MLLLLMLLGAVALAVAVAFAFAVAVAVTDTFRMGGITKAIRPYKGLIRPYKAPYDVLVVALLDPRHPGP